MRIGYIPPPFQPLSEDEARFAADHDLLDIELIDRRQWANDDPAFRRRQKQILDDHGLRCGCLGLWGLDYLNPESGEADRAMLADHLDYAELLETPVFVTGTPVPAALDREEAWQIGLEFYGELVERAKGRGLTVAFHLRHGHVLLDDLSDCRRFLEAIPDATVKIDPANLLVGWEEDLIRTLFELAPRCGHFHIKDGFALPGEARLLDQCPAGMGDVPWGKVVDLLYLAGYEGVLSIEPHGRLWGHRAEDHNRKTGVQMARDHVAQFLMPEHRPRCHL